MDNRSELGCDPELQALLTSRGLSGYAGAFARQYLTAADLAAMSDPEMDVFFDAARLVGMQREQLRAALRSMPVSAVAPSLIVPPTSVPTKSSSISSKTLQKMVDMNFPQRQSGRRVYEDDEGVWSCMLNQTNIALNSNKFFVIQIVVSDERESFSFFSRWGRVGETGAYKLVQLSTLHAAKEHFKTTFKNKTSNEWSERRNFVPRPGKYILLEMDYADEDEGKSKPSAAPRPAMQQVVHVPTPKGSSLTSFFTLVGPAPHAAPTSVPAPVVAFPEPLITVYSDGTKAYDVILNRVNIAANNNHFFAMSLLTSNNECVLRERTGRVGELGRETTHRGTLEQMLKLWEDKYRDLTGNEWCQWPQFNHVAGKFAPIISATAPPTLLTVPMPAQVVAVTTQPRSREPPLLQPPVPPVNSFSGLASTHRVFVDEAGVAWSCMLVMRATTQQAVGEGVSYLDGLVRDAYAAKEPGKTVTAMDVVNAMKRREHLALPDKIYEMQLLVPINESDGTFLYCNSREGADAGSSIKYPAATLEMAKETFRGKFLEKTHNDWSQRGNFQNKPGMWALLG